MDTSRLPKWAQKRIADLEVALQEARENQAALQLLLSDAPEIKPDILPPDNGVVNGWLAFRPISSFDRARVSKACTSHGFHNTRGWDETKTQHPRSLFSSPELALRSLLPQVVAAYRKELVETLKIIEKYEGESHE